MNLRTAIIDLYDNEPNQGMRCLKDIITETDAANDNINLSYNIFETRYKNEIPGTEFDIYISSGGPGSPFDGEGSDWERKYFNLLDSIRTHNEKSERKKYLFFICHSFQIMARYFKFAEVTDRHSKSFGIMPVHKTDAGMNEPLFAPLPEPFYGADFRDYQVIQPNEKVIKELGAEILALEKIRPHVEFERAIMAVRISDEIFGTQFHPEADYESMYYHFKQPERKMQVVEKHGEEKYFEMLKLLEDPLAIQLTRATVIPGFLKSAINKLVQYVAA